jgi:hypothetical protein
MITFSNTLNINNMKTYNPKDSDTINTVLKC